MQIGLAEAPAQLARVHETRRGRQRSEARGPLRTRLPVHVGSSLLSPVQFSEFICVNTEHGLG